MSFIKKLINKVADENTNILSEGGHSAEVTGYYDTGSYVLNALISGSLYDGIPSNKVTVFAGEPSTGKTYLMLEMIGYCLRTWPDSFVVYFDTESATTADMFRAHGIDAERVILSEPDSVEDFRKRSLDILKEYASDKEAPRMIMVLDSLGNLPSRKEANEAESDSGTVDMTKSKILRATFRLLTLRCARVNVPLLVTNHVYDNIGGYGAQKIMGGGKGLEYAASTVVFLSKAKYKLANSREVEGALITARLHKSRLSREGKSVTLRLLHRKGLERYFGLANLALDAGIWSKVGNKINVGNDAKYFETYIYNHAEKFFTSDVMDGIEEYVNKEFKYGADIL